MVLEKSKGDLPMQVYITHGLTYWVMEADSLQAAEVEFDRRLGDPEDYYFLQGERRLDISPDTSEYDEVTRYREATPAEVIAWDATFVKVEDAVKISTLGDLRNLLKQLRDFPNDTPVTGTYESRVNVTLTIDAQWAPMSNPGVWFNVEEVE
jgi:hypothetical protein